MASNARNKKIKKISPSQLRQTILEIVNDNWPIHPSGVCKVLGWPLTITNISRLSYHFNILSEQSKINVKKIDRALTAWPRDVEKLRVVHEFMKEDLPQK